MVEIEVNRSTPKNFAPKSTGEEIPAMSADLGTCI